MKQTLLRGMTVAAVLCLNLLILPGCGSQKESEPVKIPVLGEVGALVLPDTIAPVVAPFDMPEFKKPEFPDFSLNITDKGAKQQVLATREIQAAVDEVHSRGGGTVIIPQGSWLTGRISLKSNVNLHISEGAEVNFSGEIKDYLPVVFTRNEGIEVISLGALIYACEQENIAVTGKGRLIGPPMDCEVRKRVMNSGVIENVVSADTPVADRIYDGSKGGEIFLPMFISPINCKNVYIEGVTLERTPFWNVVPVYCDGVIIRGITVQSVGIPRGDGIDIESSRNVLIEYSTLSCGDDCFTMKAGRAEDGIRVNKPSENIVVRYCLAEQGHGAITCGSETAGMIRNLYVHDCVFEKTGTGIRFKTRRNRGGGGDNLIYERIRMNLSGTAFNWDMLGSRMYVGNLADRLPAREINRLTPSYKNIVARDIVVENTPQFFKVTGIPETPLTNVLIENAEIKTDKLILMRDVDGITFKNVKVTSGENTIDILDGRNIRFDQVDFITPDSTLSVSVEGELSGNIQFVGTTPEKPAGWSASAWEK